MQSKFVLNQNIALIDIRGDDWQQSEGLTPHVDICLSQNFVVLNYGLFLLLGLDNAEDVIKLL